MTFRVRGSGRASQPAVKRQEPDPLVGDCVPQEVRDIYLPAERRLEPVPCYDLDELPVGGMVSGNAVIWSPITTVVIPAGQRAQVDPYRNLIIEMSVQ